MIKRRDLLIGAGAVAAAGAGVAIWQVGGMGSMQEYEASVAETRAILTASPEMKDFIRYATLAPSGHNTQPWRFRASAAGVTVLPDFTRRTPVVDPDDHHLFASLGCAVENISNAAISTGRSGDVVFDSTGDGAVTFAFQGASHVSGGVMFDAIPKRQSTRAPFDGRAVSGDDLDLLATAAGVPGVETVILTDQPKIAQVRDLVIAGNDVQMSDPAFLRELKQWIRFNPSAAMKRGDGLFSACSGNPSLPSWLGGLMFDQVFTAQAENDRYMRQLDSSAGVAVFFGEKDDREHWMLAGRASQRFALMATAVGLKVSFVNQPGEVAKLRPELAALCGMQGRRPDLIMRFGYGDALPYSARRPVSAVLA